MGKKIKPVSAVHDYLRGYLGIMLIVLILIAGLTGAMAAPGDPGQGPGHGPGQEPINGFVYFADESGTHLKAFSKPFPAHLNEHELGMALLETLLAGPPVPELKRLLPEGTRVNALFITTTGDAYVDLEMDQEAVQPSDTITELLGVYSLVNSLTLNIPAVKQVKILKNGQEGKDLGQHLSLAPFFKTNMLIVK